jgi:bacteriorhodopsin
MQYLYYTIAAIALYFVSDLILVMIEKARGKPFEQQRSLVFLVIIMVLAVGSFKAIELLVN